MSQSSDVQGSGKKQRGTFQYSLRTLFVVMTAIAVALAIAIRTDPVVFGMMVSLLALIAAHVFGNALGTKLRDETDHHLAEQEPGLRDEALGPRRGAPLPKFAAQELGEPRSLGLGPYIVAVLGALAGGWLGGKLVAYFAEVEPFSAAGWLGIISSGVLGGLFAFLAASLLSAIGRAWSEVK